MNKRINVTRPNLPDFEEYIAEIADIWDSRWLTNMGDKHNRLERELEKYLKVENISLFSNGHMALESALQALELTGEVITTPFTFASTTHAIVRNGLTPVFCDVDPESCTLDASKLEQLITDKTSAILPVHVYGNICDVQAIQMLADQYNLRVVYDAAHAFGVEVGSVGIGSFGDMSMFSLHATKVFHTIEGGAVACQNQRYLKDLHNLKNFGIGDEEHIIAVGGNSKMNEFQAAMGLCNLRYLDEQMKKRGDLVQRYCERLSHVKGISILLQERTNIKRNYGYMPVFFDAEVLGFGRDEVCAKLAKYGIFARKYFYPLTSDFDCYRRNYSSADTPISRRIADGVLTLPLYGELPVTCVDKICDIILEMA